MILVTGATGFLGSRVCERLRAAGRPVIGIGRCKAKIDDCARRGFAVVQCDISNPRAAEDLAARIVARRNVEAIVHCAALSAPTGSLDAFIKANLDGTRTMVDLARKLDVRRFVQISSPAVYFAMRDQVGLAETSPLPRSLTHYAETKRRSEEIVFEDIQDRSIVLRPRGIYGPGDTALLPRLVTAAKGGRLPLLRRGVATTDITFVEDVVDAVLASLDAPENSTGEIYNISGGEAVNIKEIIERSCARVGVSFEWKPVPVHLAMGAAAGAELLSAIGGHRKEPRVSRYGLGILAYSQTLDISKAARLLGWTPKTSFEEGFEVAMKDFPAQ